MRDVNDDEEDSDGGLLEQLVLGRKPANKSSQLRRDYYEKQVPPKPLTQDEQFLSDFDPSKYSQEPTIKKVDLASKAHISQLKKTIEHLEQLKTVFRTGTANRMVVSQACGKLKLLLRRLEGSQRPSDDPAPPSQ